MSVKYFFDTEFHEDQSGVQLISIGIVSADGREYYAVNKDYDQDRTSPWLRQYVIPNLLPVGYARVHRVSERQIRAELHEFCEIEEYDWSYGETEFWAYYGAYDWYLLCRLMGGMLNKPEGWPHYFKDLMQVMDHLRIPRNSLPPDGEDEHNALADAKWIRNAHGVIHKMFPFSGIAL